MPTTTKRSLRYPPGTGVTPDVARDLGYLTADLEAEVGVVAQRAVLEVGLVGQTRAGRALAPTDFTEAGLNTPVAIWNCADLTDASGNGLALTNKGSVPFGVGIAGAASTAAVFAGSTAQALYRADTGGGDQLRIRTGSWGGWMRTAKRTTQQVLLSKYTTTSNQRGLRLLTSVGGGGTAAGVSVSLNGTSTTDLTGSVDVQDDKWHFVVGTYDGNAVRLYVDGQPDGVAFTAGGPMFASSGPLNVGGEAADGGAAAGSPSFGRVGPSFVTGDVLTAEQIQHLMGVKVAHGGSSPRRASLRVTRRRRGAALANGDFPSNPTRCHNIVAGAYTDLNGGASVAPVSGGTITPGVAGPDGQKDSAVYLADAHTGLGATDTGLPSGTNARSFGIWFNTASTASQTFLSWGTTGTAHAAVFVDGTTGRLHSASGADQIQSGIGVSDGQWHHALVVEDNSAADGLKRKLYLDGSLVGASTVLNSITLAGSNGFRLGANPNGSGPLSGALSRGFVFAGALAWEQVQAIYLKSAAALVQSPKDAADHVDAILASDLVFFGNDLEPQWLVDLEVSR